mmetsp:Transcript_48152/g.92042  ORF Transcript_48152/g.92042 Transcript_48152/m.92042 type:complete len:276 (-) Transcript_48152:643-1470(-)
MERKEEGPRSMQSSFKTSNSCDPGICFPSSHSWQCSRMRSVTGTPSQGERLPRSTLVFSHGADSIMASSMDDCSPVKVCGARKPMDPRLTPRMGGHGPWNMEDACRMTPSPPRHSTRSTWLCRECTYTLSIISLGSSGCTCIASSISKYTCSSTKMVTFSSWSSFTASRSSGSRFLPSFLSTNTTLGGASHMMSSCCVLGWLCLKMPSVTCSRVHVHPSLLTRYTPTEHPILSSPSASKVGKLRGLLLKEPGTSSVAISDETGRLLFSSGSTGAV